MSEVQASSPDRFRLLFNVLSGSSAPKPVSGSKPKDAASVLDAAHAAHAAPAPTLDAVAVKNVMSAAMTDRVDAFFAAGNGPYTITTPAGDKTSVKAGSQFRMVGGFNYHAVETKDANGKTFQACTDATPIMAALGPKAKDLQAAVNRVVAGRGTPEDVRAVTQALIDRGHLGAIDPANAQKAIQAMQWKFGVGIDCAGYVQRAFLAARGLSGTASERAAFGLQARVVDEGFGNIAQNPRFKSVPIADARVGDLMILGQPDPKDVGHAMLVRSNAALSTSDQAALGIPSGTFKGPVRKVEVDSSWGAGNEGLGGGVQRRTFLYDESTGRWATFDPANKSISWSKTDGPYDHPLTGVFRPKSES